MEYFVFYIEFEDKVIPVYCLEFIEDPCIKGHYLFTGVKHLDDNAFPDLKVHSISLPKNNIKYYIKGKEKIKTKETPNTETEQLTVETTVEEFYENETKKTKKRNKRKAK